MSSRGWVAVTAVSAIAAVAAVVVVRGASPQRSANPQVDVSAELASLRDEVAQLRLLTTTRAAAERIAVAEQTGREPKKTVEQESQPTQKREPLTATRLEEVRRRSQELQVKRFKVLDEQMAGERRDDAWATSTERAMRDALGGADFSGSKIEGLECRRALCKITVSHADEAAEKSFSMLFLLHAPQVPNALFLHEVDGQNQEKTVAFLTRDAAAFATVSGDHLVSK